MFYETASFLLSAYLTVPFAVDCWQICTSSHVDTLFSYIPPNNMWDEGKQSTPPQLFQNVPTFKSLRHSQTGSFAIAWQLYLFLELSNSLQKAARVAVNPELLSITFIKKQHFNCHDLLLQCLQDGWCHP